MMVEIDLFMNYLRYEKNASEKTVLSYLEKDFVKEGAIVIDAGICRGQTGEIQGDVDFMAVKTHAGAITPVPGGVGPVTVAVLMENTVRAYMKATRPESKVRDSTEKF